MIYFVPRLIELAYFIIRSDFCQTITGNTDNKKNPHYEPPCADTYICDLWLVPGSKYRYCTRWFR